MVVSYGDRYWETVFSSRSWGKYPSEEAVRGFARAKNRLRGEVRALDIGCGIGAVTWFMSKEGAIVTVIDGSTSALKKLKKVVSEFGVNQPVDLIHGDITHPKEFISKTYNLLVDHYSVYANPAERIRIAYDEFFDIVEPGGYFLSYFFGTACSGLETGTMLGPHSYKNIDKGVHRGTGTISVYTRIELEGMFIDIGYEIVYYEHILQERDGIMVEKHITCLRRPNITSTIA